MNIENVVVVDDDEDIRSILSATLETFAGWKITEVDDPRNAKDVIESIGPEVLILDWMMPHISGVELFNILKEKQSLTETVVIFMTAKVQKSDRAMIDQIGAHLIEKPFDPAAITMQIRKIAEQFLLNKASAGS
jgi:two-component system phosphate regulon response regulator PhoB